MDHWKHFQDYQVHFYESATPQRWGYVLSVIRFKFFLFFLNRKCHIADIGRHVYRVLCMLIKLYQSCMDLINPIPVLFKLTKQLNNPSGGFLKEEPVEEEDEEWTLGTFQQVPVIFLCFGLICASCEICSIYHWGHLLPPRVFYYRSTPELGFEPWISELGGLWMGALTS